ncbi:hypothetical protein GGR50DRAFT_692135 [Xylaria sp. CBS 124048]|nr:hypothetical protein GGR50DRAFT_692135 [Xylaria sp. CBS 124048]
MTPDPISSLGHRLENNQDSNESPLALAPTSPVTTVATATVAVGNAEQEHHSPPPRKRQKRQDQGEQDQGEQEQDEHQQQDQPQTNSTSDPTVSSAIPDVPPTVTNTPVSYATTTPTETAAETPNDHNDTNDPPRLRACEPCRGLKVKCEHDPFDPRAPCARCVTARRSCFFTEPQKRRPKKSDARVADLEKKINALTATIHATRGNGNGSVASSGLAGLEVHPFSYFSTNAGPPPIPHQNIGRGQITTPPQSQTASLARKRSYSEAMSGDDEAQNTSGAQEEPDIVDRGFITAYQSSELFERYCVHMAPHLPAVIFPVGTTCEHIRRAKPTLFLAIMSVASSETPFTQRLLVKELMEIFAQKIIVRGEKSLELVQSILVSVIWYFPPEQFEELQFYQMVHVAAIMAIDIGLGQRKNNPKSRLVPYTWRDHPFRKHPLPDPTTIESRRTWLALYFLASNVAMALHRPNLVRWQSFIPECLNILETSGDAAPGDAYLCHLVWTHRLAEEVGLHFSIDDPSVLVNIADPNIQQTLAVFERDLASYQQNVPAKDKHPSLRLSFHVLNLYMHEIALQTNDERGSSASNADSLRDPILGWGATVTAAHIAALTSCLTAIQGIFDTILDLDISCIRCLPMFNFVRVAYAVVVLIKIFFTASSPHSEIGKIVDKENMKVTEYLDRLFHKFREAANHDKSRPASKFLLILGVLRGWYLNHPQVNSERKHQHSGPQHSGPQHSGPQHSGPQHSGPQHSGPQHSSLCGQQPPDQPPQSRDMSEYGSANAPLHSAPEARTNKNSAGIGQSNMVPSNFNVNVSDYAAWMGAGAPQPVMFGPNQMLPISSAGGDDTLGNQYLAPWMCGPLVNNMGYISMGDGLDQAMGLTMLTFPEFPDFSPENQVIHEDNAVPQNETNYGNRMNAYAATTENRYDVQ